MALARSLGAKLDTNGTATAAAPAQPAAVVASNQVRRSGSSGKRDTWAVILEDMAGTF